MAELIKAYRFRIYPTEAQKKYFDMHFDGCAKFYNYLVSIDRAYFEKHHLYIPKFQTASNKKNIPGIDKLDSAALSATVKFYEHARNRHIANKDKVRRPAYKVYRSGQTKRYTTAISNDNSEILRWGVPTTFKQNKDGEWVPRQFTHIALDNYSKAIKANGVEDFEYVLKMPKGPMVPIIMHRQIPKNHVLSKVTISLEPSGEYHAILTCRYTKEVEQVKPKKVVGLDYSLSNGHVDSDGGNGCYPHFAKANEKKLKYLKEQLKTCNKNSCKARKIELKIAKIHTKIKNQRLNYQHHVAKQYASENDVVCVETLDIRDIASKKEYRKSALDISYPKFVNIASQKLGEQGKHLVKVDEHFPSTLICSNCGNKKTSLPTTKRTYKCQKCGAKMHRDINAAINIKNEGIQMIESGRANPNKKPQASSRF